MSLNHQVTHKNMCMCQLPPSLPPKKQYKSNLSVTEHLDAEVYKNNSD